MAVLPSPARVRARGLGRAQPILPDSNITISYNLMRPNYWSIWISFALVAPAAGHDPGLQQREQSFTIHLNGPVPQVTPLFGPVRESEWAPDWHPHFLHPLSAEQREGAVFSSVGPDAKERIWLLTAYNPTRGQVEYIIFAPGSSATQIKIWVAPEGEKGCVATVTYRRSALSPDANAEVAKLNGHWADLQRVHWQTAINNTLAKRPQHE